MSALYALTCEVEHCAGIINCQLSIVNCLQARLQIIQLHVEGLDANATWNADISAEGIDMSSIGLTNLDKYAIASAITIKGLAITTLQ